jgi:protease IV
MVAGTQIELRNDPAGQILIVKKILSQALAGTRFQSGQGLMDFRKCHPLFLTDPPEIHNSSLTVIPSPRSSFPKLFTLAARGDGRSFWKQQLRDETRESALVSRPPFRQPADQLMKKSGCAIVVLFLVLCASLFANFLLFLAMAGMSGGDGLRAGRVETIPRFQEVLLQEGDDTKDKIAVIPLTGIIASGQAGALGDDMVAGFKHALGQAQEDPHVKAVVISVDSPGGEITASDVLYHSLKEFTVQKPTIVYFNSLGASGAYYTACGASYIMCNATTFTGSIGVIISTLNYRELFGKIGLESVVFKSGKFKDMLNGAREMTPEEKVYVEGMVMQGYDRFVGIVAKARGLDEQTLRNGVADGRILSGTDALEAKLVNELGYIEDAYEKARELGDAPGAKVVRYKQAITFSSLLGMFGEIRTPSIKVDLLEGHPHLQPGRVYLLPPFFAP